MEKYLEAGFQQGWKSTTLKNDYGKGMGSLVRGMIGVGGGAYWQSTASPLPWRNLAGTAPQKTQSFEEGGGVSRLTAIEGWGRKDQGMGKMGFNGCWRQKWKEVGGPRKGGW